MKKLTYTLFSFFLFSGPSLAKAVTFCVGNFTGTKLLWNVRDPGRRDFTQEAGQEWLCDEVPDPRMFYMMEVSFADHKYDLPSCELMFAGKDIIEINAEKNGDKLSLKCEVQTNSGATMPVKMQTAGASTGWRLVGTVQGMTSVYKRVVILFDRNGKQIDASTIVNANGQFVLKLPTPSIGGFKVVSYFPDKPPYPDEISAIIPENFDVMTDGITLNTATTLTAKYAEAKKVDLSTAEKRTREYFGLYDGINLEDFSNEKLTTFGEFTLDLSQRIYYPQYVDALFNDMKKPGTTFKPVPREYTQPSVNELLTNLEQQDGALLFCHVEDCKNSRKPFDKKRFIIIKGAIMETFKQIAPLQASLKNSRYKSRFEDIERTFAEIEKHYANVQYYNTMYDVLKGPVPAWNNYLGTTALNNMKVSAEAVKGLSKKLINDIYINLDKTRTSPTLIEILRQELISQGMDRRKIEENLNGCLRYYQLMQTFALALWLDSFYTNSSAPDSKKIEQIKDAAINQMIKTEKVD